MPGPVINQGAARAKVFVAGEFGPAVGELDELEDDAGDVFVELPVAVGSESGVGADFVFKV